VEREVLALEIEHWDRESCTTRWKFSFFHT